MEEFDFHYHIPTVEYPESGNRMRLGNSYQFASKPVAPDERLITLHFSAMRNFCHPTTGVPDSTTQPAINFYRLELFYQRHRLWKAFTYTHPQYGVLVVKFSQPLKTPKRVAGIDGFLEGFTVELIEQP